MALLLPVLLASTCLASEGPAPVVPKWPPTYNMSLSTIIMPCDENELMSSGPNWPIIRDFGVIDIDWSNSKQMWINTDPMTTEENLLKQAQLIKKENPMGKGQKVWVYRNTVLAMPWFTTVRKIMDDPSYDVWFLKFKNGTDGKSPLEHDGQLNDPHRDNTYHEPVCDRAFTPPKCSVLYHAQVQTMETKEWPSQDDDGSLTPPDGLCTGKACDCGRVPCGMYLFDHRMGEHLVCTGWGGCLTLREWFVHNLTISETGLKNEAVDGFYLDDDWTSKLMGDSVDGTGDLNGSNVPDCGLSPEDVKDLKTGWMANMDVINQAILDNGGFFWQATRATSLTHQTCATSVRAACKDSVWQHVAMNYGIARNASGDPHDPYAGIMDLKEHLAGFLLIRGPYAWIGYGWLGCSKPYARPKALDSDYGTPVGFCEETAPGVFEREWTKAKVKLDCNAWQGSITPKPLNQYV